MYFNKHYMFGGGGGGGFSIRHYGVSAWMMFQTPLVKASSSAPIFCTLPYKLHVAGKKNNAWSDHLKFYSTRTNVWEWTFGAKHNVGCDTYRKFHAKMMKHAYSTIYESKNGMKFYIWTIWSPNETLNPWESSMGPNL